MAKTSGNGAGENGGHANCPDQFYTLTTVSLDAAQFAEFEAVGPVYSPEETRQLAEFFRKPERVHT